MSGVSVSDCLVHLDEARIEIQRLRAMIDQSADGKLLPDCEALYCPNCANKVRQEFDLCYCEDCPNADSGEAEPTPPLPLSYFSCYSTREAAEAAKGE